MCDSKILVDGSRLVKLFNGLFVLPQSSINQRNVSQDFSRRIKSLYRASVRQVESSKIEQAASVDMRSTRGQSTYLELFDRLIIVLTLERFQCDWPYVYFSLRQLMPSWMS